MITKFCQHCGHAGNSEHYYRCWNCCNILTWFGGSLHIRFWRSVHKLLYG